MIDIKNVHERIKEINKELLSLEEKEKYYKTLKITSRQHKEREDYEDVKSSIFFLVMERQIIQKTIDYFKKEFKRVEKEYPEHYWRWQFYGKILSPDKVIPFTSDKQEEKK